MPAPSFRHGRQRDHRRAARHVLSMDRRKRGVAVRRRVGSTEPGDKGGGRVPTHQRSTSIVRHAERATTDRSDRRRSPTFHWVAGIALGLAGCTIPASSTVAAASSPPIYPLDGADRSSAASAGREHLQLSSYRDRAGPLRRSDWRRPVDLGRRCQKDASLVWQVG